jgi:hypothetical protein
MRRCLTLLSLVPLLAIFISVVASLKPDPSEPKGETAPPHLEVLAAEPAAVVPDSVWERRSVALESIDLAPPPRHAPLAARCERMAEIQAGVPESGARPERGARRGEYVIPGLDGEWGWSPPANWNVARVESLVAAVDVPLALGTLRLVDDASQIADADRHVLVRRLDDGELEFYELSADAQGRLHLQLVPAYALVDVLSRLGDEGRRALAAGDDAQIDWSRSRSGRPELRVRRGR